MRISSITPMKDEGPFILEWVAYHRAIGINDPIVFTNDCSDGTEMILERLDEMGLVRHLPNPSMLMEAVRHHWTAISYVNTMPRLRRSDYYLSFDVDEFLCVNVGDGTVQALINAMGDAQVMALCQLNFGTGAQLDYRPDAGLQMEQFTKCMLKTDREGEKARARGVKSFVRVDPRIRKIGNHSPYFRPADKKNLRWINGSGVEMDATAFADPLKSLRGAAAGYEVAQINHYALRSIENFLFKASRGNANHPDLPMALQYFRKYDQNDAVDTGILRWADRVRDGVAEMLEDPELSRLHYASVAHHQAKIAEIRGAENGKALWSRVKRFMNRHHPEAGVA